MLGSLLQACGGSGSGPPPITNLESINVDPIDTSIAVGTKVQLQATGTYKNKTTKDITDSVTWESVDTKVAVVSDKNGTKGLASGDGAGATTVSATLHGIRGVSSFTVTKASLTSITLVPVNPLVAKGTTVQMAAQGNFSDGSVQDLTTQVSWSSGNSSIAQVSNTSSTMGLVTGVSAGNAPITATFNGVQGSSAVTVTAATLTSITITDPLIAKSTAVQLTATCNFNDGTTENCTNEASWTSGDSGIAQVSDTAPSKGLVTGVGVGSTSITGTFGGIQGAAAVTVTSATLTSLTITPPNPSIAKATAVQLIATGNFSDGTVEDLTGQVSWISGNDKIAHVSNKPGSKGLVTGLGAGGTAIIVTFHGVQGSTTLGVTSATLTSLTITPPDPSIAKATAVQLTATGNFSDGTTEDLTGQVSWESGNETMAQVSGEPGSKGLVTGLATGSTAIAATLNGVSGSTTVTVTAATLTSIVVTAKKTGLPNPSIAAHTTVQLTATGDFSDGTVEDLTGQVSWISGNDKIAHVSNVPHAPGIVTGLGTGNTSITATLNSVSGSTTVTVTAATLTSIVVTATETGLPTPSIAKGTTVQLTAIGTFSDKSTEDLTSEVGWTSDNTAAATVSNFAGAFGGGGGLVSGVAPGSANIAATLNGVSGSTTVTVTAATLTSIVVTATGGLPNPSIAAGTAMQLTATGDFSDGSTEDLTHQVSWTSDNTAAAIVSNSAGAFGGGGGLVSGVAQGSAGITATLSDISGFTTVTVIGEPPIDFTGGFANPVNLSLNNGASTEGTRLLLTDGGSFEARSAFFAIPIGIQSFTNDFSFLLTQPGTAPLADGMTFTIYSGTSFDAVGLGGASLGYAGIPNSVAVKFDLYTANNKQDNSTGLYRDGQPPTSPAIPLDPTVINLHSGHIFRVHMTYDGTNLTVSITDTVTNAVASQVYAVNIPQIVGAKTAFVGFTAGTGRLNATQEILSWTFVPGT